jgi:hypothetical protein
MSLFKNPFGMAKDKAKEMALNLLISTISKKLIEMCHLDKLGELSHIKIQMNPLAIHCSLNLRGEEKPVDVGVEFRLLPPNRVEISKVTASREWIAILANEILPAEKKRFEVPETVITLLS